MGPGTPIRSATGRYTWPMVGSVSRKGTVLIARYRVVARAECARALSCCDVCTS